MHSSISHVRRPTPVCDAWPSRCGVRPRFFAMETNNTISVRMRPLPGYNHAATKYGNPVWGRRDIHFEIAAGTPQNHAGGLSGWISIGDCSMLDFSVLFSVPSACLQRAVSCSTTVAWNLLVAVCLLHTLVESRYVCERGSTMQGAWCDMSRGALLCRQLIEIWHSSHFSLAVGG